MEATQPPTTETTSNPSEVEAKRFPVLEIFGPVIQGEGSQAGTQTLFIRFGGCDYRCERCDSLHAVDPIAVKKHARRLTAEEIFQEVVKLHMATGVRWVTFSGGNPLMHKLDELVEKLNQVGLAINVETQATLWQDWLYNCTVVTVSPKSWGMGEKFEEDKYRKFLTKLNGYRPLCVKIVVFSAQDVEFAIFIQQLTNEVALNWLYGGHENIAYYMSLGNPYPPILNDEHDLVSNPDFDLTKDLLQSYKILCEEILPDPRTKDFKFLPQLHVLVYGNETGR